MRIIGCARPWPGREARKGAAMSGRITVAVGAKVYGSVSAMARDTYIVNVVPVVTNIGCSQVR